jgi:acetoin utilization deacetylase AcuC-like enzyme
MATTGILTDKRFLDHRPGPYHPESHRRLEALYAMLEERGMADRFQQVPAQRAEREELLLVHAPEYVDLVASTAGQEHCSLDPDTATSPGSYEAALLAAGGLNQAISGVISGELRNAFALVRPPGHHAEGHRAMGFCLFNNVAVGAKYAQRFHGLKRILIIDWDLHHGNGTQHTFEEDASVLYFSTHQYPYYPGSGALEQVGRAEGAGFTVNVPLAPGQDDTVYVGIFEKILRPVALEFDPELILVSAGFDIHADDPLGGMHITPEGFAALTRSILDTADACCEGKVVLTLEGGYDLKGLTASVKAVLNELSGQTKTDPAGFISATDQGDLEPMMQKVIHVHGGYWKSLTRS